MNATVAAGVVRLRSKFVGTLKDGVYLTLRRPWHYFDKYGGFGVTVDVLLAVAKVPSPAYKVVVHYQGYELERWYEQPLDDLMHEPTIKPDDRWDEQKVLLAWPQDRTALHWELMDYREKDGRWGPVP